MIRGDGVCNECKRYHEPARDHKDECPEQPRIFWSRESEVLYYKRKALELKDAVEACERRKAAEQAERERGKANAILRETLRLWHEQWMVESAAQAEQLRGELSAAREQRDQQARVRRLARNLQLRERRRDA